MKTLSRILFTLGLILVLAVANAQATTIDLTYGDAYYVGSIVPDVPTSPSDETEYLNYLITLAVNEISNVPYSPPPGSVRIFSRVGSIISSLDAVTILGTQFDAGNEFSISGGTYILGKYGTDALVWFVTAAGDYTLPTSADPDLDGQNNGLSHYTVWTTTPVPEPGTLLLLGGGLLGLGIFARRRMNK